MHENSILAGAPPQISLWELGAYSECFPRSLAEFLVKGRDELRGREGARKGEKETNIKKGRRRWKRRGGEERESRE